MTFPSPSFEYFEEATYDVLQTRFPDFSSRSVRADKKVKIFRLMYKNRTKSEKDDVRSEFITAKGASGTTSYTPVDAGSPVTVRFLNDEFEWTQESASSYFFEIELIEDPR